MRSLLLWASFTTAVAAIAAHDYVATEKAIHLEVSEDAFDRGAFVLGLRANEHAVGHGIEQVSQLLLLFL